MITKYHIYLGVLLLFGLKSSELNAQYFFNINDFKASETEINLSGSAKVESNFLSLTQNKQHSRGACWYKAQKLKIDEGFDTHFTFRVNGESNKLGDGFAFVIQNISSSIIGMGGTQLGYGEIKNSLALEFDTKNDEEGSKNHISISVYDKDENRHRPIATVHSIDEISNGKEHFTKIEYRKGHLTVYLDSYLFPVLSLKIDLNEYFSDSNGEVWMGFTGSTSEYSSHQELMKWSANVIHRKPENITTEKIRVSFSDTINISNAEVQIEVWDNNKVDGDIVSVKLNDDWILTDYMLKKEAYSFPAKLTGFKSELILYAQSLGSNPPNTASFKIIDGEREHLIELDADFQKSEAILIRLSPN